MAKSKFMVRMVGLGPMLFPALSSMNKDLLNSLPISTNAQESMCHNYYLSSATQQSIITGK